VTSKEAALFFVEPNRYKIFSYTYIRRYFVRLEIIVYKIYDIVKDNVRVKMSLDRKLMRNGNGWALSINSTILSLLDINPEEDMVQYSVEKDKLIITKSSKKIEKKSGSANSGL